MNAAQLFDQIDSLRISPLTGLAFPDAKAFQLLRGGLRSGILPGLPRTRKHEDWNRGAHGGAHDTLPLGFKQKGEHL